MEWLYITHHAYQRWSERTDNPRIGPRIAWNNAVPADPAHLHGRIRYHEPTDVHLVARGPRLVTVVPARGCSPAAIPGGEAA